MMITADRAVGRPKLPENEKLVSVNLRLTREMLEWLDDQHAQRLDRPNRSTVAREVFAKVMGDG